MRTKTKTAFWSVLVVTLLGATPAVAQPVKPHILLIFDTSGSMLWTGDAVPSARWCDGQYDPVGNGSYGTDSRIYNLKEAVRQALYVVGTDEANFGIARFPHFADPNDLDTCSSSSNTFPNYHGGYYRIYTSGGNSGTGGADNNTGCVISSDPDNPASTSWFTADYDQAIVLPVTDPNGTFPPSAGDFDPLDGNLGAAFEWLDHHTEVSGGQIVNPEIQAMPGQFTPLGRSLYYARLYFDNYVIPNDDPVTRECRTNIVVLITDGEETCDSDMPTNPPVPTQASDCNAGTNDEFNPNRQACLLYRPWDPDPYRRIKTYVLTMQGLEAANDPIARSGGTGTAWTASFANQNEIKTALLQIIAEAVPAGEICDGIDNDCDGDIDEGVKNDCPLDLINLTHCAVEECNNIDDDCDGTIDEGWPPNACGGPCGEPVPPEIPCNGLDDDCNPATPDQPVGCTCDVEWCNGLDDDCDGLVDDDDPDFANQALPCGPNPALGICTQGTQTCNYGNPICVGAIWPEEETCNLLDDNCNGILDDVIYDPALCTIPNCTTSCCDGHWECVNGVDTCVPDSSTAPEECNGLDDDCDERIDEGAVCASPLVCYFGTCVFRRPPDGCGAGYYEREGLCVEGPCLGTLCGGGTVCDPSTGTCIDPCATFQCTDPTAQCDATLAVCDTNGCTVDDGACVIGNCYLDPTVCADGEVCTNGVCTANACFGTDALDCGTQVCRDGVCVDSCLDVECDPGFHCADGLCVSTPCGNLVCPPGQTCVLGQCAQNPCGGVTCSAGQVCQNGLCVDDPCRLVVCPADTTCVEGQCVGGGTPPGPDAGVPDAGTVGDGGPGSDAAPGADAGSEDSAFRLTASGGGCACQSSGTDPGWPLLVLLVLGLLLRRRRRR